MTVLLQDGRQAHGYKESTRYADGGFDAWSADREAGQVYDDEVDWPLDRPDVYCSPEGEWQFKQ